MKRKITALLLAMAMVFSLIGATAAAAETETEEKAPEETVPVQDAAGTLSFESLADRVKKNNDTALALGENIAILDALDYDKLADDLRDGLNEIADAQWALTSSGSVSSTLTEMGPIVGPASGADMVLAKAIDALSSGMAQSTNAQLDAQYDALKEQLDNIKNGKLQKENAGIKLQLQTAQNQIVMAAQTLYITLLSLERSDAALVRSLAALDRTIEEMELRYELGQISALQLCQVQAGRTQLLSGQETMRMNVNLLYMQLNSMIGEELGTKLKLQPLPEVTKASLDAMNAAADYKRADEVSYETYAAQKARDDAKESYDDAVKKYGANSKKTEMTQAKHTWQAAQYTYDASVQSFSIKFRSQYAKVKDCAQILDAAKEALALEQKEYEVAQLKYQQGTISHNALLTAEDEVASAKDTVANAASDLYSAYNSYTWAVNCGILN